MGEGAAGGGEMEGAVDESWRFSLLKWNINKAVRFADGGPAGSSHRQGPS